MSKFSVTELLGEFILRIARTNSLLSFLKNFKQFYGKADKDRLNIKITVNMFNQFCYA